MVEYPTLEDASVRLSGGSRAVAAATVAAAGGCREEVEDDVVGDDSGGDCASCCAGVARPVARLSDIWPPLCIYQAGLLDRWGTSGQRPPLENPQALPHRARPRR